MSEKTQHYLELEEQSGAQTIIPFVVFNGKGTYVWDVFCKQYYDFLSGYSAVNQGHCHPAIVQALTEQAQSSHWTSRAFHSDLLGEYVKYITSYFGYESIADEYGSGGCKTAIKLAVNGYEVKVD